jgi:hypothetical protein
MAEPAGDHLKTQAAAVPRPRAAETRRLYAADWASFAAWCRRQGRWCMDWSADAVFLAW